MGLFLYGNSRDWYDAYRCFSGRIAAEGLVVHLVTLAMFVALYAARFKRNRLVTKCPALQNNPCCNVAKVMENLLNSLSVSHHRKTTCAIFFSALAVCDSIVLLWGLYLWSSSTFNISMTWASCAVPTYFLLSTSQCGTLILITMTCDR